MKTFLRHILLYLLILVQLIQVFSSICVKYTYKNGQLSSTLTTISSNIPDHSFNFGKLLFISETESSEESSDSEVEKKEVPCYYNTFDFLANTFQMRENSYPDPIFPLFYSDLPEDEHPPEIKA